MASSAANVPFNSPDMTRNAAMYCATFTLITSQPAITTRIVMKLFSRMNRTEMPSTPTW